MLVSIIIPIHKTTPFLKECMESALNQSYTNIEILAVCNGSLTIASCKEFLNITNSKLKFFQSETGRHHARNKGLEVANGGYLQFLDFDDLLLPNKIEKQINSIIEDKEDDAISITKWDVFESESGEKQNLDLEFLFKNKSISGLELYKLLGKNKGYVMTGSWLFPARLITKNIKWEDVPNDDALFASEIINRDTRILAIPEVLTLYRNHKSNTRSLRTKKELKKLIYSWKKIRKNLAFNHYLVERYFYNAYFYMLKYSINIKGYKFFIIYKKFKKIGYKTNIQLKLRMEKDIVLFKKYFGLVLKKMKR